LINVGSKRVPYLFYVDLIKLVSIKSLF